jgi:hypothetical protein
VKIILKDLDPDHFDRGISAARWLLSQPLSQKDAILVYGQGRDNELPLYVRRNKASITVRRTN